MESLDLRIFKEVAYTQSISKAAKNMGYVQSNITAHIKKLESTLNTTLFIRHSHGVSLTKDGEVLLVQAEQILSLMDQTLTSFQNHPETLRIGTTQTLAGYLIPKCIQAYQRQYPHISFSIMTLQQEELEYQLAHEQLDCVITNRSSMFSEAQKIYQIKENLVFIAPVSCQTIADLKNYPLIVNHVESCPYRRILLNWWQTHHTTQPILIEMDTVEAIMRTVFVGGGISLLPQKLIENQENLHCFVAKDLPETNISMWIPQNKLPFDYHLLKSIVEKELSV